MVAGRQRGQRRHVGAVAIHAEDALGHDEARARGAGPFGQQVFQVRQVVMAEADLAHAGGLAAMVQAGVVEPVGVDLRLALRGRGLEQGRQHRGVGLPAAGQQQGGLGAFQARQLGFDLFVQVQVAAYQPRGLRAGAVPGGPQAGALGQQRVARQSQVVVAGEIDQGAAIEGQPAGGVAAAWRRRRRTWRCAACSSAAVNRESSLDIDTTRLVGQGQARLAVECRAL